MKDLAKECGHLEGLRSVAGDGLRCRSCNEVLDVVSIERWVRAAEKTRDEAYSLAEGKDFHGDLREDYQREVYRRRKVLYELRERSGAVARPEMLLVVYSLRNDCYECRVFYKEPRPAGCPERFVVGALPGSILEAQAAEDPTVRLVGQKVREFHEGRRLQISRGGPAAVRRVFYANEL